MSPIGSSAYKLNETNGDTAVKSCGKYARAAAEPVSATRESSTRNVANAWLNPRGSNVVMTSLDAMTL